MLTGATDTGNDKNMAKISNYKSCTFGKISTLQSGKFMCFKK